MYPVNNGRTCEVKLKLLSCVQLFATPWTIQSMEFFRPEYWSGLSFPSPGDLPNPGIEPRSPTLQADSLPAEPPGKPGRTHGLFQIFWSSNSGVCVLGHVYLFSHLGHVPPTPAKCYRFLLSWKTLQSPRGKTEHLPDATWAHCFPLCGASVSHLQMGTDKLPSSSGIDDAKELSKL